MNFRAFGILIYLIYFLITKIPQRNRLKKLSETDPAKGSAISHDQVKKAFHRVLAISGVKVETEGLENIPDEPVLFVGNHNSYFDILVTETTYLGLGFGLYVPWLLFQKSKLIVFVN